MLSIRFKQEITLSFLAELQEIIKASNAVIVPVSIGKPTVNPSNELVFPYIEVLMEPKTPEDIDQAKLFLAVIAKNL